MSSNKKPLTLAQRREKFLSIMHKVSIFFIVACTAAGIYLTINYDDTFAWYNHPAFYFLGALIETVFLIWNPLKNFNFLKGTSKQ